MAVRFSTMTYGTHQSFFLELYTDAAASKGYEAILGQRWFFGRFPDTWQSFNITFLELFPIVLAVRLWSCLLYTSPSPRDA